MIFEYRNFLPQIRPPHCTDVDHVPRGPQRPHSLLLRKLLDVHHLRVHRRLLRRRHLQRGIHLRYYYCYLFIIVVIVRPSQIKFTGSYCCKLAMEMTGVEKRILGSTVISCIYAVGEMWLGLAAMWTKNWRILMRVIYGPGLLVILLMFVLPESVRYVRFQGVYENSYRFFFLCGRRKISSKFKNSIICIIGINDKYIRKTFNRPRKCFIYKYECFLYTVVFLWFIREIGAVVYTISTVL